MIEMNGNHVDVLGVEGRASIIANMLRRVQADLYELEIVQKSNAAGDEDPLPGVPGPDGAVKTYAERRAELRSLEASVLEAADADVIEHLRKARG